MKKNLLTLLTMLSTLGLFAQTESLFDGNNSYGGFGGPLLEISTINGQTVSDVGGGGAWVINDFFIGGYGMGNDAATVEYDDQLLDIDFGHGGFWLGFAPKQHKLVHIYSSVRLGWGGVEFNSADTKVADDNMFVVTPEIGVEVNFTDWFKLGLTGGYRAVTGLEKLPVLENEDFSGMYGALTFRFGGFGDYGNWDDDDDDDVFDF